MTPEDIEAGLQACAKATPLPWYGQNSDMFWSNGPFPADYPEVRIDRYNGEATAALFGTKHDREEDVAFVEIATQQYPVLLRLIKRLRETAMATRLTQADIDEIMREM